MKKSLLIAFLVAGLSTAAFAADDATAPATSNTATTAPATTDSNANATTTTTSTNTAKTKAISVSNLLQQLQKAGYVVKEVDYDNDNQKFKVDGVDRFGEKQSLDVDAKGLTADQRKLPHVINISQAAKKVEKNGSYVKSIQYSSGTYTATVVDKQGNSQDVSIDPKTGKVSNS